MDVQELLDRQQIVDLITRYTRAVDTRNFDDLDHVFTEDAILDYSPVDGPKAPLAEARPWIKDGLSLFSRYQHTIGQIAIAFADADNAQATAYFINPMVVTNADGSETLWEVGGYYHHTVVRTPSGWRSRHMVDELVYSRM